MVKQYVILGSGTPRGRIGMLKGDLSSFSLGEVFQSLAINNHTGTLKITSPVYPQKLIYFDKGRITLFSSGGIGVPRLGDMLVRLEKISAADLEQALAEQKESKQLLGEILIRKGLIDEADLKHALEKKIREEIYDLFLWKQGSFEFHLGYFPEDQVDDLQRRVAIAVDANSAILGGLRQLDEWMVIQKNVKTLNEVLKRTTTPYAGTDRIAKYVEARADGATPIRELLRDAPGSHFDTCKGIHELIEAGHLRLLTLEELHALGSKKLAERQHPQAAAFLQAAIDADPDNPDLHEQLADALAGFYQDDAANAAYQKAMRLCFGTGDLKRATELGDRILHKTALGDEDLGHLLQGYTSLGNHKKAAAVAHQLVSSLQKKGDFQKAAATLAPLAQLNPKDLNIRVQLATLLDKAGDKDGAVAHLDDVVGRLQAEKRYRELIRILRLMAEIQPQRKDLRQRIAQVQSLEEKLRKKRWRRLTVAGSAATILAVLGILALLYEVKAREAFAHAMRLEANGMRPGVADSYVLAKARYEEVISRFSLSTKAAEAHEALERISSLEKQRISQMEAETAARKRESEAKLQAMRQGLAAALKDAAAAEAAGELKQAHEIYAKVRTEYAELPAARDILFPVRISTEPRGATVHVDGTEIGRTPVLYYYRPGTTVNLTLTKSSCETRQQPIELKAQWELHYTLVRKPLGDFTPVPTIQQPMVPCGSLILVPSRDGTLHAVDPARKLSIWQRTVGRFGDRISNLSVRGDEFYFGTVGAEVTAASTLNGKSRWIARVSSSVLAAPAPSEDGKWIAVATTGGSVEILSTETGNLAAKFSTENENLSAPLFVGDLVIVGSTDNYLYGYSMTRQDIEFLEDLGADVLIDPCRLGGRVIVATKAGTVHAFDLETRTVAWRWSPEKAGTEVTVMVVNQGRVHLGTAAGSIITLDGANGETRWQASAGASPISGISCGAHALHATTESGLLAAFEPGTDQAAWQYQSDNAILAPPVLVGAILYFGTASGKVQFIEVLE